MQTQDLVTSRIVIDKVIPADGKRPAKVLSTDGDYFTIWPKQAHLLSNMHAGGSYEMEYTEDEKNGFINRTVQGAKMVAEPQPALRGQYEVAGNRLHVKPDAKPQAQNGNGYYRPTSPRDSERMFVCSILNAFIQTGRIDNDVQTLTRAVADLRQVWADTFGMDDK